LADTETHREVGWARGLKGRESASGPSGVFDRLGTVLLLFGQLVGEFLLETGDDSLVSGWREKRLRARWAGILREIERTEDETT
jgi:hypothetical protein